MANSKMILIIIAVIGLFAGNSCLAEDCTTAADPNTVNARPAAPPNTVDAILKKISDKTLQLNYYQGQIEYKFIQPLLESEAVRKGTLYYAKFGKKSKLRINFATLKQDDEKEEKYREEYIFDGVWLTQINYQIKSVRKYQLTEPNKPADAFDVASDTIPLIGFTKIDNLKKQFEISLVDQKNSKLPTFFQLHLKVKPNSTYKDDYVSLDFWIDKKLSLPTKIVAVSTEEDIYEIKFLQSKIDEKINEKTFDFKIPNGFGEPEIVPLKKKKK
ncbi:MAG: hypothetical protein JW720_01305 [Sedimentisphaerales bacterium]|nr:hypothetical protein [Sedimentisphaerales bacterium]